MAPDAPGLFARLKQHHIYRTVAVYAVIAWVIVQAASIVFPSFGLPNAAVRLLILILVLLFPVVLIAAWLLIAPADSRKRGRWQRLHWKFGALISLTVLVLVVVSGWYIWSAEEPAVNAKTAVAQQTAAPAFRPAPNSIVVLPFANLGGNPEQQYFSDGITEELTNALGKIPVLQVISWGTASGYRASKEKVTDIGKALNVASLLHGSIWRQGDRVRVTAELVNTVTGYQIWASHYDAELKDLFSVQDRISSAIAGALQIKFSGLRKAAATTNPRAHELVLKGLAAMNRGSTDAYEEAQKYFSQAAALDPAYADAYGWLAHTYIVLSDSSTLPLKTALARASEAADKALALDPDNVPALVAQGAVYALTDRIDDAKAAYRRALELDPSDAAAHVNYGLILPLKQSLAQTQAAVRLNPASAVGQGNLATIYVDLEEYAQAIAPLQAVSRLEPNLIGTAFNLAFVHRQLHQNSQMVNAFDLVRPGNDDDRQLVAAGKLTYRSLLDPGLRKQALAAVARLPVAKLSPDQQSHVIQMQLALGRNEDALSLLASNCAESPFGCADLAINPIY
ncbi:MAG: tetratricopeptide repeat protein, partial [Gammaproteobacteria bacterium]